MCLIMNKVAKCCLLILILASLANAFSATKKQKPLFQHCTGQFKSDAKDFAASAIRLRQAIENLSATDTLTIYEAKEALIQSRLAYKKIEFFMEFFFTFPVNLYNRAPVYEIEEPYMEYQAPVGLQVIEDQLFDKEVLSHKKTLLEQAKAIQSSATDIPAILYGFEAGNEQMAEAIRLELVRIIALGITGYDAPQLKTGIRESAVAMGSVKTALQPLLHLSASRYADSVLQYLDRSITLLNTAVPFDDFDRMGFLTRAALPLQQYLNALFEEESLSPVGTSILNFGAKHMFSAGIFKTDSFLRHSTDTGYAIVSLGKKLFFEKKLSGNGKRNCASCHHPDKFFTDALPTSIAFDGKGRLNRNAPSLLYAGLQHGQFLDARAGSMEEQVLSVLQNPEEMNADLYKITRNIDNRPYRKLFTTAFPGAMKDSVVTPYKIARAISAYERTLMPFNAPFDRYINGETTAMNASQIKGFNLFMGKAQCGTCHFAPVFNGLLPPLYTVTELEVLGVPGNGSLSHPIADNDDGRFSFFKIGFYKGAFKTPTVRNSSMTAPYMHNGSFRTMEDVIEFYNKGGGAGIGLDIPTQTLSSRPLNLSKEEIGHLVHFIEALKDNVSY
jgi:cytochrome c peroxidase